MDLTSPKTIKEICARFDFSFSKGLGQNFLSDRHVLEKIVEAAQISFGVLEIGPGFGVLTRELAENAEKVVSVEIDKRLIPVLEYTLSDFDNVSVIENDILKADVRKIIEENFGGEPVSIAANLPYYITTPIIARLLELKLPVQNIVVMVQKEVAERICAAPGTKDYGAISVLCRYYTEPEIITKVPAACFVPPPKVDSAVLRLRVLDAPSVSPKDEKLFFRLVKAGFAQRRKTLLNCMSHGLSLEKSLCTEILSACGIEPNIRAERLSLEEFAAISDELMRRQS